MISLPWELADEQSLRTCALQAIELESIYLMVLALLSF